MKKWTAESKIPKDWVYCSVCDERYGFIDCRITSQGVNKCLKCHIEHKKFHRETCPQDVPHE